MSQRLMLLECNAPHWIEVVSRLAVQGATPVFWAAWTQVESAVRKIFPTCVFHNSIDAKRGLPPAGVVPPRAREFDEACEQVWRDEAQLVYDMMNRFDHSRDMSFVERSVLFYRMLVEWRSVLDSFSPDLVVFPAPPHVVYDYVVLCLCRELGVETLMFEEATIYPPYSLAMRDYRPGRATLTEIFRKERRPRSASREARAIVRKLAGNYAGAKPPREIIASSRMEIVWKEGLAGLRTKIEQTFLLELNARKGGAPTETIVNVSSLYKERGVTLDDSFEGNFANTRFMWQRYEEQLETERLAAAYESYCILLSRIRSPFVYLALAGQPERTSNPQADIYCNQLLMVNRLAHAVPDKWSVVVKEHPNQFHPEFAVNMCRSRAYYAEMAKFDNVRLVGTDTDPFELIDRAEAVATTGGTTALEAVARGKPALLFGDAWFRDCPGITRIRTPSDLVSFFRGAGSRKPITRSSVAAYLDAVTATGFRGIADYPPDGYPIDPATNIASLVKAIALTLRKNHPDSV